MHPTETETVPFGYGRIDPEGKRRLVHQHFSDIARTYDIADLVLSGGLDSLWRRRAIRLLSVHPGGCVLDVCGGTADLALLSLLRTGSRGCAVVYDFNGAMMRKGKGRGSKRGAGSRLMFVQGDAEELSFPENAFDAVTVGFGLRNLVHPRRAINEMHRVLRPGGALMILEFSLPVNRMLRRLYHIYSFRVMPRAAKLICGTDAPFRYLAESIRVFAPPEAVAGLLEKGGFSDVHFVRLSNGLAVAYFGRK